MKIGDMVRVIKIPDGLPDDQDLQTKKLFSLCLGQSFPIAGWDRGRIELLVGRVVGAPDYLHSIYIEQEFIEIVETPD